MNKQSKGWMVVFGLGFLALIGWAAWAFFSEYPTLNSENLDRFITGFGPLAVVVYALAYLLSSPIPFMAPILAATGGLLFGPFLGTFLAISCAAATSLVPFMVSRRLGRDWVEAKMKGTRLDNFYKGAYHNSGFNFILMLRLVPVMPWEMQNYIAGVTQVSVPTYLAATVLGSAPLSIALVILGAAFKEPNSWQFFAALALTGGILLGPIAFMALSRRRPGKNNG